MKRNFLILMMILMLPFGIVKAQGLTHTECEAHIARIKEYVAKGYDQK